MVPYHSKKEQCILRCKRLARNVNVNGDSFDLHNRHEESCLTRQIQATVGIVHAQKKDTMDRSMVPYHTCHRTQIWQEYGMQPVVLCCTVVGVGNLHNITDPSNFRDKFRPTFLLEKLVFSQKNISVCILFNVRSVYLIVLP